MAFEEHTEQQACPECGALHELRSFRIPVREYVKVQCLACKGTILSGKSVRDYDQPQLISPG